VRSPNIFFFRRLFSSIFNLCSVFFLLWNRQIFTPMHIKQQESIYIFIYLHTHTHTIYIYICVCVCVYK
jgi:hypothetical protein